MPLGLYVFVPPRRPNPAVLLRARRRTAGRARAALRAPPRRRAPLVRRPLRAPLGAHPVGAVLRALRLADPRGALPAGRGAQRAQCQGRR